MIVLGSRRSIRGVGSNTRWAFQGVPVRSLVAGTTCALDGDDVKVIAITVAGCQDQEATVEREHLSCLVDNLVARAAIRRSRNVIIADTRSFRFMFGKWRKLILRRW